MKIPISEARQKLPKLVKELQKHPGNVYEITSHNEVVARLSAPPSIEPGEAAAVLLALRKKRRGRRKSRPLPHGEVSENKNAYLYGDLLARKKTSRKKR